MLRHKADEPSRQREQERLRLPCRAAQARVGAADGQHTAVKGRQRSKLRAVGAGPVQPVCAERALVAVVVAILGTAPFLARLHKGKPLTGQVDACRHAVLRQHVGIGPVIIPAAGHGGQLVPQGIVVVGGDILHHLPGAPWPKAVRTIVPCTDRVDDIIAVLGRAVDIAGVGGIKDIALDAIARIITEKADPVTQRIECALVGRACAALQIRTAAHPWLAVHQDAFAAGQAVERGADRVHRVHILQRHQIKAEAVDVVGFGPVQHRIHDEFAHHGALAGKVAAAAGAIGHAVVGPAAVPVAGDCPLKAAFTVIGVVVDHIHDNAQPRAVQGCHHGAALAHANLAVERIRGKAALRHIVVLGVIAPVVAAVRASFVHGGVVKDRLQLHMADAQPLQVVQAGRMRAVTVQRGVGLGKAHEFPAPFGAHTAARIGGEVRHMHLPHAAGVGRYGGARVCVPALGGGTGQVQHHAALAVGTGAARVGVHDLLHTAVREVDAVEIVGSVQVARQGDGPHAVGLAVQLMHAALSGAGLGIGAGCIQADYDPAGRGCPQLENSFLRRRICTEVAAAVIGQFTRLLPVHG